MTNIAVLPEAFEVHTYSEADGWTIQGSYDRDEAEGVVARARVAEFRGARA